MKNWKINFLLFLVMTVAAVSLFDFSHPPTAAIFSPRLIEISAPASAAYSAFRGAAGDILGKIKEGQRLLADSSPLDFSEKGRVLIKQETALAILDTVTGEVLEQRYWLDENEMKKANTLRQSYAENTDNLPRFRPVETQNKFHIITRWWNSFNSDLLVENMETDAYQPDRYMVIGIKFLTENRMLVYPEDHTGKKYSDLIYVPYSDLLRQPALLEEGKNFLEESVSEAFAALESLRVESRAYPGQLVTETVNPVFIKNIFLTEQTDPLMMLLAGDGGMKLAERVLIRLGANREKAFRYTFSRTGALGLGQIMPGTYSSIVRKYREASLIKDTNIGRADIKNSIMASILVFDDHLAYVFNRLIDAQRKLFDKKQKADTDFVNEVRAAIYNGGPGKYEAMTATISTKVSETVNFIQKYRSIRALKLF